MTAAPSAGYQFIGWSGDATGTTNPLTVTMTASKTITANFAAIGASRYVSDLAGCRWPTRGARWRRTAATAGSWRATGGC
ncbi:MAG: hypothetical protein IPH44_24420 [Myxococcales bacterium]|nr:hypothetical protein [Myxococcales bacterium]